MIHDYSETHKTILNSLPNDTKHIGYSQDSLVFKHENYVYKCVVWYNGINIGEEVPILLKLMNESIKNYGLSTPLEYFVIDESHLLHKLYIFKFPKYDYDFDRLIINSPNELNGLSQDVLSQDYLSLGDQLIQAVNNLHDMGFYHGDLKPKNICIWNGKVQIIDFGTTNRLDKEYTLRFRKNSFGWCTPKQYLKLLKRQFQQVPLIFEKIGLKLLEGLNCAVRGIKDIKDVSGDIKELRDSTIESIIESITEDCRMNDRFIVSMILLYLYSEKSENVWSYDESNDFLHSIIQVGLNMILFLNNKELYVSSHLKRMITSKYNDYIIENLKLI